MNKGDIESSVDVNVLEEQIKTLSKQLDNQKKAYEHLESRLRSLEIFRGSQDQLKDEIHKTSETLQELQEQNDMAKKTKWYDLKQVGLVLLGAILSYLFSKYN